MFSEDIRFNKKNLKPAATVERSLLSTLAPISQTVESEGTYIKGVDGKWQLASAESETESSHDACFSHTGATRQMEAPVWEMHGQCYGRQRQRNEWVPPRVTYASDAAARPGYGSINASEYADTPEVLRAKVSFLAQLISVSRRCVIYAGAGLSTAAGIRDYATRRVAPNPALPHSPMAAQPTLSHYVLVGLHRLQKLHRLVQQNHDGLPQKAGMPQEVVNEIHGSLHAPDNPVVPMSGCLRQDLLNDLLSCAELADLVIAVGTSLAGMSADKVVHSCAQRAKEPHPTLSRSPTSTCGSVIIGMQRTPYDGESTLRIFATCDEVFALLSEHLPNLAEHIPSQRPAGEYFLPKVLLQASKAPDCPVDESTGNTSLANDCAHLYKLMNLRYDAMGQRVESRAGASTPGDSGYCLTTLDLSEGAVVVIPTGMHAGASGEVVGYDRERHVKLRFNFRVHSKGRLDPEHEGGEGCRGMACFLAPMTMTLGTWWLQAAVDHAVEQLPVVSPPADGDESVAASRLRTLRQLHDAGAAAPCGF